MPTFSFQNIHIGIVEISDCLIQSKHYDKQVTAECLKKYETCHTKYH